ncbi:MAG: HEAT repeat domain-containing protein [Anaerolineae bacterium]|nr:HEAT repeat domain-containing protein [Anaerolineae bacterium]
MTPDRSAILNGLLKAARDESYLVRSAAVRALGKLKERDAVPELLVALRDGAGFVADFAIAALSEMPGEWVGELMLERIADEDDNVRRAAVMVLGAVGYQAALPGLINALNDPVAVVQQFAAEALGKLQDAAAVPALLQALERATADGDWALAINTAQALSKIGAAEASPAIIALFRRRWDVVAATNSTPPVRKNAVEALARLGAGAMPYLLEALRDPELKVRHGAIEALGQMIAQDTAPTDNASAV